MREKIIIIGTLVIMLGCLAETAGAASIYFDPASVTLQPGLTSQVRIVLSDAPKGLTGYEMILTYPSSTMTVTGASFPSWAGLNNMHATKTGYLISGIDINKQVNDGATDIELATVTVKGVSAGTTTVTLTGFRMNDDADNLDTPSLGTLPVTVGGSQTTATTTTTATPTPTASVTTTTTTSTPATTATSPSPTATTTSITTSATTTPVTTGTKAATTTAAISTTVVPAATITVPAVVMVTPALAGSPTCGFTTNKIAGYAPMEVRFRDLSSGNSLTGWEWSFGDGGSSMTQNPTYTYRTPGTYTVALTVTNDLGSTTSTRTGLIRVLDEGEPMPTVTQAAPVQALVTTEPLNTLPVWTAPQRTAPVPTTKKAAAAPSIVITGLTAACCLVLIRQKRTG